MELTKKERLKILLDKTVNDLINRVCYESGYHTIWSYERGLEELKKTYNYPINPSDDELYNFLINYE